MRPTTIDAVIFSLQRVEADVADIRRQITGESLAESDRQYIGRCFDLLEIEVTALRQYVDGLR